MKIMIFFITTLMISSHAFGGPVCFKDNLSGCSFGESKTDFILPTASAPGQTDPGCCVVPQAADGPIGGQTTASQAIEQVQSLTQPE